MPPNASTVSVPPVDKRIAAVVAAPGGPGLDVKRCSGKVLKRGASRLNERVGRRKNTSALVDHGSGTQGFSIAGVGSQLKAAVGLRGPGPTHGSARPLKGAGNCHISRTGQGAAGLCQRSGDRQVGPCEKQSIAERHIAAQAGSGGQTERSAGQGQRVGGTCRQAMHRQTIASLNGDCGGRSSIDNCIVVRSGDAAGAPVRRRVPVSAAGIDPGDGGGHSAFFQRSRFKRSWDDRRLRLTAGRAADFQSKIFSSRELRNHERFGFFAGIYLLLRKNGTNWSD